MAHEANKHLNFGRKLLYLKYLEEVVVEMFGCILRVLRTGLSAAD